MFNTDSHGIWTVVHPAGEIDLAVAAEFRSSLMAALSRNDHLAIDFSEVTFMDSSGISAIVTAFNHKPARGHLVLFGISDRVRRVLEIIGLTQLLEIHERLDQDELAFTRITEEPGPKGHPGGLSDPAKGPLIRRWLVLP